MATVAWWLAAFGVFLAACSTPALVSAELRRIDEERRPEVTLSGQIRRHARRAWVVGAAVVFLAWGASYIWLVAEHVGVLAPAAERSR